jgi:hypothetical protein
MTAAVTEVPVSFALNYQSNCRNNNINMIGPINRLDSMTHFAVYSLQPVFPDNIPLQSSLADMVKIFLEDMSAICCCAKV